MPKTQISTQAGSPPGGPYSQGIRAGDFLFVAGQVPKDPVAGQVADHDGAAGWDEFGRDDGLAGEAAGEDFLDYVEFGKFGHGRVGAGLSGAQQR